MSKSNRIKVVVSALRSMDDVRAAVRRAVDLQLRRERLVVMRDAEIKSLIEKSGRRIDDITVDLETYTALIEQWAEANPEAFGSSQSIKVEGHQLGWRLGNPRAQTTKKVTWAEVLKRLLGAGHLVRDRFLRVKHEVNKEAMVAARDTDADTLLLLGVEIVQTQTFYLDPDRDGQADALLTGERREVAA